MQLDSYCSSMSANNNATMSIRKDAKNCHLIKGSQNLIGGAIFDAI